MSTDTAALLPLRQEIDAIDDELLRLFNRRAALAQSIGHLKAQFQVQTQDQAQQQTQGHIHTQAQDQTQANISVMRPEREAQIVRRLQANNAGPLSAGQVQHVFKELMSVCRALEHEVRVAFLGPVGTYSQEALWAFFGHAVLAQPQATIEDTIRALQVGSVDFAVVPVENSTEGSVARTLDALVEANVQVCGEVQLPIAHQLLNQTGQLQGIQKVCAHPQALAQCRQWLARHLPHVQCEPVNSNGQAAAMASQEPGVAAIAGVAAQQHYGLQACAANIHDDVHNTTRFLILGQRSAGPSGLDKTSLVVAVPNTPGALHRLLAPLAAQQVSLSRFESRPARTGRWEYYFFMDVEGHESDPPVASVLAELRQLSSFFKVLGSYPVADQVAETCS